MDIKQGKPLSLALGSNITIFYITEDLYRIEALVNGNLLLSHVNAASIDRVVTGLQAMRGQPTYNIMGRIIATCGHDVTDDEHAWKGAWWRKYDDDGRAYWFYGVLCASCFRLRKARVRRPRGMEHWTDTIGSLPYVQDKECKTYNGFVFTKEEVDIR